MSSLKKVRFGIVGVGNIGREHVKQIQAAKDPHFEVTAVCDIVEAAAKKVADQYSLKSFGSAEAMYQSGLVDAVLIAMPHYWHAPMTVRAAQLGLHVLCEKPIAVTVGAARTMVRECKKHKVALGVMFMWRTKAIMRKMKEMVDSGQLGRIHRVQMVCSTWYRTQFYYDSGAWRGTWDGEGGGVIMNQAPHTLDLFQWIGGMPSRVTAVLGTRTHKIDVENDVNAICEYKNGATGYLYVTTADAPGQEQFIISGDKGTLITDYKTLTFSKLKVPLEKHLLTTKEAFCTPQSKTVQVPLKIGPQDGLHLNATRAFVNHLLKGTPMTCSGQEAVNEIELANAIYLAGFGRKSVDLPVDSAAMERLLDKLIRQRSTARGGNIRAKAEKELKRLIG